MIDICDFAGRPVAPAARPDHRLQHGHAARAGATRPVAIVAAFNFPVAVWAWNAAIALVCGDSLLETSGAPCVRSPASACSNRRRRAWRKVPRGLSAVIVGGVRRCSCSSPTTAACALGHQRLRVGRALAPPDGAAAFRRSLR